MLCATPFVASDGDEYGCGQCMPCRINKRREWTCRIQLEALAHKNTEWVTLTYSPESLPTGGTLVPSHVSLFMRSLRQKLKRKFNAKLRFFAVGEYGSRTDRPHYHIFLFGLPKEAKNLVQETWQYGHVMFAFDPVTSQIAAYTAGYTVKKEGKDREKLKGKAPEFSRMSLKPPIGYEYIKTLGQVLSQDKWAAVHVSETGDVPASVNVGGKSWPLGRTLRSRLREEMGYGRELSAESKAELRDLRIRTLAVPSVRDARAIARSKTQRKIAGQGLGFLPKKESL